MLGSCLLALSLGFAPAAAAPAPAVTTAGADPSPAKIHAHLKLPVFEDAFEAVPVARVGGELITLGELTDGLAAMHQDAGGSAGKKDVHAILDRLIDLRLLVAEARDMGLDELDEARKEVERYRETELREVLKREAVEGVLPDQMDVDRAVREAVREWKLRSVLFDRRDDAVAAFDEVARGADFAALAEKLVADGKAKGGKAEYFPASKLAPEVLALLQKLEPGVVSATTEVKNGWVIVRVEDVRHPENPAERAKAESASLQRRRSEELKRLYESLVAKYARIDRALFAALDYHSVKRFEGFMKDRRPLVRIAGEAPVTVADLSAELRKDFYHGLEAPVRDRKVNSKKENKLEAVLSRRLFTKEARARKLHESEEYARLVRKHTDQVLFGMLLERAVLPDVEVKESEVRAHYDAHPADYTFPQLYTLDGIAFPDVKKAEAALVTLRKGTDFRWLKANAEGQLPTEKRSVALDASTVTATSLPRKLAEALQGAKPGESRLFTAAENEAWVVTVLRETAAAPQPYLEAREAIARKLFGEKRSQAVKDYAAKLRQAHPVEVYISRIGE